MNPVAVVSDTTHYLPRELVEQHGIHVVSLYVNWSGRTDREADMPDFDAYYEYLRSASDQPTTSQPSVGDFLTVYEPLVEAGKDIVSIHLSGAVSGTVLAAEQARQQLVERGVAPERIVVLDSETTAGGLGLLVLAAANASARGAGVAEAAERARALRRELQVFFMLDTLEYLRRGGRVGAAQAWVGSTLRIKPILSIEAEVKPIERVRTAGRAFERLVELLQARRDAGHDAWVVQHIHAHQSVAKMLDRGRELFGREPEFISQIGPVVGTHAGPGMVGVTAIRRALLDATDAG
jgi:DegV family protein with EDD domain